MNNSEITSVQQFTSKLLYRQHALNSEFSDQSLVLGDALLLYSMIYPATPALNTQLVIIGPTQSGKSTVVNLLLGGNHAEASPLAGYTRHGQGFSDTSQDIAALASVDSLLPWLKRVERENLSENALDEFSLEAVPVEFNARSIAVWDTPDFDSVSSRGYRATVPQLCAIADGIVMVVSREKYADQSVWSLLELLVPSGKAITLLLNKVSEANQDTLLQAVNEKLTEYKMPNVQVLSLPYLNASEQTSIYTSQAGQSVQNQILDWVKTIPHNSNPNQLQKFLQSHWAPWTADIRAELHAQKEWHDQVSEVISLAQQNFQDSYITTTDHSDALQKAMVRLLELLEVPAVAGTLGRLRSLVTWPARQLSGFIKKQPNHGQDSENLEHLALSEQVEISLLKLKDLSAENIESQTGQAQRWWQSLNAALTNTQTKIDTLGMIENHQSAFEPKIEQAAHSLHKNLQDHPVTLNGLRAARASTDAAAVVLAIKSGGLGLSDLVFAPAMLAFTSMLTEGALGQYMSKIEQELQTEQINSVDTHLFTPLQAALLELGNQRSSAGLIGISEEELLEAEAALEAIA